MVPVILKGGDLDLSAGWCLLVFNPVRMLTGSKVWTDECDTWKLHTEISQENRILPQAPWIKDLQHILILSFNSDFSDFYCWSLWIFKIRLFHNLYSRKTPFHHFKAIMKTFIFANPIHTIFQYHVHRQFNVSFYLSSSLQIPRTRQVCKFLLAVRCVLFYSVVSNISGLLASATVLSRATQC